MQQIEADIKVTDYKHDRFNNNKSASGKGVCFYINYSPLRKEAKSIIKKDTKISANDNVLITKLITGTVFNNYYNPYRMEE